MPATEPKEAEQCSSPARAASLVRSADPSLAPPENLGEGAPRELEDACIVLKVSQLYILGYRDSGMAGPPENEHPASFHQADLTEGSGSSRCTDPSGAARDFRYV